MSEGTSNSVVNLGDISKPATVLVEKIADAVGGYFKPYQIVRVAEAEAEAEKIKAKSEIEISDLKNRAVNRFVAEEIRKQQNIEAITEKAIPLLADSAKPQEMDDDWIAHFFDKCRLVSNAEMQELWSKVLAGEANQPGKYSKRTVSFLSTLDKSDAALFSELANFEIVLITPNPVVFDHMAPIYVERGVTFDSLSHLESIGLIKFGVPSAYGEPNLPKTIAFNYQKIICFLEFPKENNNTLLLGQTLYTKVGVELSQLCKKTEVPGFLDYTLQKWRYAGKLFSPYPRVFFDPDVAIRASEQGSMPDT